MSGKMATVGEAPEPLPPGPWGDGDEGASLLFAHFVALARRGGGEAAPSAASAGGCPNCGRPSTSPRSPYCGDPCREEAGLVRQARSAIAQGAELSEERRVALGEKLWRLLGGGYPRRVARLTQRARERVLQREGGRCETCGGPADRIDHCGSG